jgi:glucose/arabinose dehydrogenase
MNFGYNGYMNNGNPYARNYGMPTYAQPQYAPQPQQMAQPQMPMQQTQPQQPMQYEMPIQFVGNGTLKEAEAYILFPNQKAMFIDKTNGMVYEKISNQDGQSFITHFKKVENKAENQAVETPKEQPTIDLSSYAKKDDLGQFVSLEQYKELLSKFETLQKQVMGVRPNVATSKQQ